MGWTGVLNEVRGFGGVEVYHWAEMDDTVVNPPHRHTYFEVCWVEDGHGTFVVEGQRHGIGPGSLLFARPGVRHQIISPEPPGIRLSWVAFQLKHHDSGGPGGLGGLFRAFAGGRPLAYDAEGTIGALWSALRRVGDGPARPGRTEAVAAVAEALVIALAQAGAAALPSAPPLAPDAGAALVRQALRYVQDNADRPIRVDELARHLHVSPRQLTRLFGVHVGQSPAAYVERARLDHAVALLLRTELPVKQVAAEVGYADVAQFTRAFSRRYGAPPARFRKAAELGPALAAGTPSGAGGSADRPPPRFLALIKEDTPDARPNYSACLP